MSFVRKMAEEILGEVKAILREYANETGASLKKHFRKLLITGIVVGVLVALVISLLGSAVIFILIGSLEYLETFMPAWKAWDLIGLAAGAIGVVVFLLLIIIIRKQLRAS